MIKAVVDTNVLVSGIISPKSSPAKIINLWQNQAFILVVSKPILQELRQVLSYPKIARTYHLDKEKIDELLMGFSVFPEVCSPKERILVIKEDPDDNKFLEAAFSAKVDFLVSGDKHLLALGDYKGIEILTPRGFLRRLK